MAQTKYTDGSGVSEIWLNIKNYVYSQLLGKADASHTHTKSQITDFPSYGTTANTICEGNDSRLSDARTPTSHTHVKSEITDFPSLATVATSGSYNDLSNKPTIPTVNNATLTIQKNGTTVKTFTANASSNVTANITVPTKTSDLTNDSHVSITTETDTTSTGTPAHGGTFTCIDSVTRDSNGHVTKVNTKTVTLPSDSNTDTLVTQNVSTANENHPILLSVTKDATTNQGAKTSIFASGVKVNPSTGTVTATTFSGALSGNASTATQFSANKAVTLTGDVTGTASSKAGWSVATTLANSGVTAGTYGPSADVTGNNNATISVPEITVDAKGRVTSVTNRTLTCKNNTYNVYNKTLTIQKNGTNVATFTSNSNTNVTANISVPTKTSDLTNDSGFLTLESLSNNSIPFHNAYPRCKYLGTSITDAQNTAIKNRTYDDLFIGDYWTINGINWRIVAIDYYYNVGDTNFDKGNIIVMPDTVLYNAQMNETDTTAGGYVGSLMRTQNLNNARTIAQNAFGSHLANHRILLTNSVDTSGPNNWAWYDSDGVELANEVQIYGTRVWGSALKGYDVATQKQQFPLMVLAPQFVNTRQNYWLQDVSSTSVSRSFACVYGGGYAVLSLASHSGGVRPSVTLSYV